MMTDTTWDGTLQRSAWSDCSDGGPQWGHQMVYFDGKRNREVSKEVKRKCLKVWQRVSGSVKMEKEVEESNSNAQFSNRWSHIMTAQTAWRQKEKELTVRVEKCEGVFVCNPGVSGSITYISYIYIYITYISITKRTWWISWWRHGTVIWHHEDETYKWERTENIDRDIKTTSVFPVCDLTGMNGSSNPLETRLVENLQSSR